MPQNEQNLYPEIRSLSIEIIRCYVRNPRIGPHWMGLDILSSAPPGSFGELCIKAINNAMKEVSRLNSYTREQQRALRETLIDSFTEGVCEGGEEIELYRDRFICCVAGELGLIHSQGHAQEKVEEEVYLDTVGA
jgi:hypothetical protein